MSQVPERHRYGRSERDYTRPEVCSPGKVAKQRPAFYTIALANNPLMRPTISRQCSLRRRVHRADILLAIVFLLGGESIAQTVQVDANPSHVVNKFSPLYALGTSVDRVPGNATDVFFRPDQLQQVLSAGWGSVTYRQNTELFVQAWHWNPEGDLE